MSLRRALEAPALKPYFDEIERIYKKAMAEHRNTRTTEWFRALDVLEEVRGLPERLKEQEKKHLTPGRS